MRSVLEPIPLKREGVFPIQPISPRLVRLLVILFILFGGIGGACWLASTPPPEVETVFPQGKDWEVRQPPPPSPNTETPLETEIQTLRQAVSQKQKRAFNLRVKEEEANALLQQKTRLREKLSAKGLDRVFLRFEEDQLTVLGSVKRGHRKVWVTIKGYPLVTSEGQVHFELTQARLGRLPLPNPVAREFLDPLIGEVTAKLEKTPVHFQEIEVREGEMLLKGFTLSSKIPD